LKEKDDLNDSIDRLVLTFDSDAPAGEFRTPNEFCTSDISRSGRNIGNAPCIFYRGTGGKLKK
jgi:hypothetical protein